MAVLSPVAMSTGDGTEIALAHGSRISGGGSNRSTLTINGGRISTQGQSAYGVHASINNIDISMSGGTVETTGLWAAAINIPSAGGSIETTGVRASGIHFFGADNVITMQGSIITTTGDYAGAISSFARSASKRVASNSQITLGTMGGAAAAPVAIQSFIEGSGSLTLCLLDSARLTGIVQTSRDATNTVILDDNTEIALTGGGVGLTMGLGANDALSYESRTTPVAVTLDGSEDMLTSQNGFRSRVGAPSISSRFSAVNNLIGGMNTTDSLTGADATATWTLARDGSGNLAHTYVAEGSTLDFSGFETLTGGAMADAFNVNTAFSGNLDGGGARRISLLLTPP